VLTRLNFQALQTGDKYKVTTPVNWRKGDDVIVHPSVSDEEAKTLFPDHTVHKVRRLMFRFATLIDTRIFLSAVSSHDASTSTIALWIDMCFMDLICVECILGIFRHPYPTAWNILFYSTSFGTPKSRVPISSSAITHRLTQRPS
jgi:predicted membrane protein